MGIFSDEEKSFCEGLIDEVHDTFMKEFLIIQDSERIIVTHDVEYNSVYKRNRKGTKDYELEVRETIAQARVLHALPKKDVFADPALDSQLRIHFPSNTVRFRVDKTAYEILKEAKRVELEGIRYSISSDFRPHGLFEHRYFDFYLQKIDE